MRKTLLHPAVCLVVCAAAAYLLRETFGLPRSGLATALFLAAYGYACSLALIPWICFSDWGRMMAKKKMGDVDMMSDPIFVTFMSYQPQYVALAIVGGLLAALTGSTAALGAIAVLLAGSATFAAWRAMRWSSAPA